jgi:hypothetical protein
VTQREGRLESQVLFHDMQIRVANACASDPDQHLPRARRWLGNILYFSGATDANESDGLHGCSSSGGRFLIIDSNDLACEHLR